MDAVYILGTGSRSGNEEIKYSVRSLEKHMLDLGSIFVVGAHADCLPGATWIEASDPHKKHWQNAMMKTRLACADERVSADFLLMNDDFFMLADFEGVEFPFYTLKGGTGGSSGVHDYAIHCPMRINKEMYSKMPLSEEMSGDFSPRSFYGNFYKAPPDPVKDSIVRTGDRMKAFAEQTRGREFCSVDDVAMLDPEFKLWMQSLYPMPSKFEA